jgi:4-carboxymuconolactone decarboxylase
VTAPGLDRRRWILIRISSALAAGTPELLAKALQEAFRLGHRAEVDEVILQSYLFLGYPIALNAFAVWRDLAGAGSVQDSPDDWEGWRERGEDVCRTVYGGQYGGLRRNVRALHPDMERWMVVEGYGKVLGRPGLDLATRELCIAALLAVLGAPRQLYSHLRGALNAGALPGEVEGALHLASEYLAPDDWGEVLSVWDRVLTRIPGGSTHGT